MTTPGQSKARVAKLRELERELAKAAGLRMDRLSTADKLKLEHCALLQLQASVLKARILSGGSIDTNALIAISEALKDLLPAAPLKVEVAYVDGYVCESCKQMRIVKAAEAAKLKEIAAQPAEEGGTPMDNPAPPPLPLPFTPTADVPRGVTNTGNPQTASVHNHPFAPLKHDGWPPPWGYK